MPIGAAAKRKRITHSSGANVDDCIRYSTGVPLLGVPLAMSKILSRLPAEPTDRLLAADGLMAQDSDEEEDDEDEDAENEEEGTEDEDDGYSE